MDFFAGSPTHTWMDNIMEVIRNDGNSGAQQRQPLPRSVISDDLRPILAYLRDDTNAAAATQMIQRVPSQRTSPSVADATIIDLTEDDDLPGNQVSNTFSRRPLATFDAVAETSNERGINARRKVLCATPTAQSVIDDSGAAPGQSNTHLLTENLSIRRASNSCLSLLCPVCLDGFDMIKLEGERQVISTICGHLFCSSCITAIMQRQKQCPTCRKSIRKNTLRAIFL